MKKPNFVVILVDDLRHDELGAGGHPCMKTPNVDRVAAEGALFERAFHTTPICPPNRASIMRRPAAPGVRPLGELRQPRAAERPAVQRRWRV